MATVSLAAYQNPGGNVGLSPGPRDITYLPRRDSDIYSSLGGIEKRLSL